MIKKMIMLVLLVPFLSVGRSESEAVKIRFTNITTVITYSEFENIKAFILEKGDQMTYRNYDNNNPHYRFKQFDVFLGADVGQRNINNDPNISDFNAMTIADSGADIRYYQIIIVRKGDVKNGKAWLHAGMEEGQVYLSEPYGNDLSVMENNLRDYMKEIKAEMKKPGKNKNPVKHKKLLNAF